MHFNINNSYTAVVGKVDPEHSKLINEWCTKEYDYYGLDFSQRPPRRTKKTDNIRYFNYGKFCIYIMFLDQKKNILKIKTDKKKSFQKRVKTQK